MTRPDTPLGTAPPTLPEAWTAAALPRQDGRTVIITGATSGIGLATAREFARVGGHVVLAVRDTVRGHATASALPGSVEVQLLDLADLSSVRAFTDRWSDRQVDVLINNAGVFALPESRTADGFETQMGTNHLGHFALTNFMLPRIRDRVVVVGSLSHVGPQVEVDDLNWRRRRYNRFRAYQQSKLANLLHASELQHRLAASGSKVRVLAAHPGWVSTPLQSHTGNPALNVLVRTVVRVRGHSASHGAWPTLLAATADLPASTYLGPDGRGERTGHPALARRSDESRDRSVARALWTRSVELTGTDLPGSPLRA